MNPTRLEMPFQDMPVELLPLIIRHVPQTWQLARIAAASRVFNVFATEHLYHSIYIYAWHKNAKAKVWLCSSTCE